MTQSLDVDNAGADFVAELGKKVKTFRKNKKLTQGEAAQLCGVGTRFISNLENGKATIEMGKAVQVLHALDLELNLSDTPRRDQQIREVKQHEALAELGNHLSVMQGDVDKVIPRLCEAMAEVLQAEYTGVWFFNQAKDRLLAKDEYTLSDQQHEPKDDYKREDYPEFFKSLLQARTLVEEEDLVSNINSHEFAQERERYGVTSTLDTPIKLDGEVLGIISSEHRGLSHTWAGDEITFHGQMAGLLIEAIRNQRYRLMKEDLAAQNLRTKRRQALIIEVINCSSLRGGLRQEALEFCSKKIAEHFAVSNMIIWLESDDSHDMNVMVNYDRKQDVFISPSNLEGFRAPHIIADSHYKGDASAIFQKVVHEGDQEKVVIEIGIYISGQRIGVIGLECSDASFAWSNHESNFLIEISSHISQLIINARLKDSEREINSRLLYAGNLQKVVSDLSTDMTVVNPNNLTEAIQKINEAVASALEIEGCGVWLTDKDGSTLTNVDYYERSTNDHYVDASYQRDEFPSFFESLEKERTIAADDAQHDARTSEFLEEEQSVYGISSSMDTVIRLHGRTAGILNVEHYGERRKWLTDEISFHGAVADLVGFILVNLQFREQEKDKSQHLELENKRIRRLEQQNKTLSEVAMSSVVANGEIEEAMSIICKAIVGSLNVQRVEVWWFHKQTAYITIAKGYDKEREFYQEDEPYDLNDSPGYLKFLTSGRNIVFGGDNLGEESSQYFSDLVRDETITAGIDVAIRVRGETVGLVAVEHCYEERVWEQDEIGYVTALSDQITQAYMNKEKVEFDRKQEIQRKSLEENQRILVDLATHKDVVGGNIQAVADLINKTAARQLNVYSCAIWMFDYDKKRANIISSYLLDEDCYEGDLGRFSHDADFNDDFYTTLKTERTVAVKDVSIDPLTNCFNELFYIPENITSTLESAIRVQGETVGAINLDHKGESRDWDFEAVSFCAELSDIMAHALMNHERIKSEQSYKLLAEKREEMDAIINGSGFVVVEWGVEDNVEFISDNVSLFGYSPEDFYNDPKFYINLIHPLDYEQNLAKIDEIEKDTSNTQYTIECRIRNASNQWVWIEEHTTIYRDSDGNISHYHGVIYDIDLRKENAHQLLMLSSAIEHSASGVFIINAGKFIEYVNPTFCEMTAYRIDELIGEDVFKIRASDSSIDDFKSMLNTISTHKSWHGELEIYTATKETVWILLSTSPIRNDAGELTHYVAVCEDISEHKLHQQQMEQLAYYDTLTGLENRRLFKDNLDALVRRAKHNNEHSALLFLDLDRFKIINDTLGHDAGDKLLVVVAERLQQCVAEGDSVARLGGDEFTIVLKDIQNQDNNYVSNISQSIIDELCKPIYLGSEEVTVTVSVGITITPSDSVFSTELMKNADLAMYKAKNLGRNNYQFYSADLNVDTYDQMQLENELRHAINNDELILHYQPIFDHGENTVAVEALVRWQHPDKGILLPDAFINIASEIGVLIELEKIVLDKACQFACYLSQLNGGKQYPVCINVSKTLLFNDGFLPFLRENISRCKLDDGTLHLEIAEDIVISQRDKLKPIFEQLQSLGVRISIDDFGSGYSALNYLRELHIDSIKIDQNFIQGTDVNLQDQQIVPAIIALAHKLDIEVIGEGVETQTQLSFLNKNKCDYHQGHLFEQAMTQAELLKQMKISSESAK